MGLTAAAIVSNAMFLQSIRHPDPIFSTRPAAKCAGRRRRTRSYQSRGAAPTMSARSRRSRESPSRTRLRARRLDPSPDAALVAGPAEGARRQGPLSRARRRQVRRPDPAAIAAFEEQEGLPVTGRADRRCFSQRARAPRPRCDRRIRSHRRAGHGAPAAEIRADRQPGEPVAATPDAAEPARQSGRRRRRAVGPEVIEPLSPRPGGAEQHRLRAGAQSTARPARKPPTPSAASNSTTACR